VSRAARPKRSLLERREERTGWLLLAPAIVVLLLVGIVPLIQTFVVSLTDAFMAGGREWRFLGMRNYSMILRDAEFWVALRNTLLFTVSSVALEFALGMAIALVLNSAFRGRGLVRAAVLIPWALPTVVAARVWSYMLVDTYGVVNDLLLRVGLIDERIAWLAKPGLALLSMVLIDVWKTTPFVALILLAGLQLIPRQLYEAASVDGATPLQRFFRITLPMLRPAIFVALVFRTLDALRVFDVIWVLTRGELETESLATYNFRHMIDFRNLGYGSAVSVVIFVVIAMFVTAYVVLLRRKDYTS
jgi:trehalose/maltose transport system permease protein